MTGAAPSAFAPLRQRLFLVLWTAALVGNTGQWIRDTASAWLMTDLAPSPVMVALVQAASTLPVFLLSLPAGALADIVDKKRMMIFVQFGLAAVSLALGLLTLGGAITPAALLLLTLAAGAGGALAGPVWQSIVPDLVPKADLKPAVALNSLGINIARAIGPALAGLIIVSVGVAAAYFLDVATYLVTLASLLWWPRKPEHRANPERLGPAMGMGVRYLLASPDLRRVLLRAFLFFLPASCFWALLPLVARTEIGGGPGGYGVLLGAVGAGAIGGALLMPRLRARLSAESFALAASLLTGAATAALSTAATLTAGVLILGLAGAAWLTMLTTLNATAQALLPNWVRGRGLALYLTVFFGTMTLGSLLWGQVASATSLDTALLLAGGACVLSALVGRALPLPPGDPDQTPSHHWPEPATSGDVDADGGPIMVMVEYSVAPQGHAAFEAAAAPLRGVRLRSGAYRWGLMVDAQAPDRLVEWFLVASWAEHLRQHGRVSVADRAVQEGVLALHEGSEAPRVRHLVPPGGILTSEARAHLDQGEGA